MRVSRVLLSFLLAVRLAALPLGAQAVPVSFSPDLNGTTGKLTGKIPLDKLGSVTIPRGRLKIKGNRVEVSTVQEWQFDHYVILSGPVLNTQQRVYNGKLEITGLAYFTDGDWLDYLSPAAFEEIVSTGTEEFTGRILSIACDAAEIRLISGRQQKIPLTAIREIHSPRAFRFTVSAAAPTAVPAGQPYETDAYKLSMLQTARQFRASALRTDLRKQGDGDLTTGQLIAIGTLISGIEIGQMVPFLVVPLMANRLQRTASRREYEVLTNPIGISPSISIPNYLVPPPRGVAPAINLAPASGP